MKIYLVYLVYDIIFDDSDYGESYAGEGLYILKAFDSEIKAQDFISKNLLTFKDASKEIWSFPMKPYRQKLKDEFGIDLHDIESNMDELKMNYKVMMIE